MLHTKCLEQAIAVVKAAIEHRDPIVGYAIDPGSKRRPDHSETGNQTRRNTNVPLVPPKPNELLSTTSNRISRAVFGT